MYKHDTIKPFGNDGATKTQQVATMFDQIAHRYDFLNRFLSGGIDYSWRKKALKELLHQPHDQLLDVATGTADIALLAAKLLKPAPKNIIGIDISEGMLALGRKKVEAKHLCSTITLQTGDSEAINFANDTFDAVTVAFGVRNFSNLEKGLKEMLRVLKPGGKLVVLEFSKPVVPGARALYNFYTGLVAPQAGKWIAGNKAAYKYLNDSINAFPEGQAFLDILAKCGYVQPYRKPLTLGICTIYCGSKP